MIESRLPFKIFYTYFKDFDVLLFAFSADCRTPYDTSEIEHQLIDAIQRKVMGYTLQDLQCLKCKEIKMMNLASHCTCAGKFKTLIAAKDLAKLLKTFKSIATHYGMPLLKEVVQWNIKMAALHV